MSGKCPRCGASVEDDRTVCPKCRLILPTYYEDSDEPAYPEDIIPNGAVLADDYLIVRMIGMGGAGTVYEARQISLDNMPVALKVLHQDLNEDERIITLLKKEVIIARELTHESVMKVYSLEKMEDRHFIVMEYIEGESLQAVLDKQGACSLEYVAPITVRICGALQYAHDRGVMHLDIKPANILVRPDRGAKLCDFGIARMAVGNATTATQRIITGSVGYMPPEQYRGRKYVSFKSDVYALGATVYAALTGDVPIGVRTDDEAVPRCVLQAMRRNPDERYATVREFKEAFVNETGLDSSALKLEPQAVSLSAPPIVVAGPTVTAPPVPPTEVIDAGSIIAETDLSSVPTEFLEPSDTRKVPSGTWWKHARISFTLLREEGARFLGKALPYVSPIKGNRLLTAICALLGLTAIAGLALLLGSGGSKHGTASSVGKAPKIVTARADTTGVTASKPQEAPTETSGASHESLTRGVDDMLTNFVESLNQGSFADVDPSYGFLSKESQQKQAINVFRDHFFDSPRIWKIEKIHKGGTLNGQTVAEVELSGVDGYLEAPFRTVVLFDLVREHGEWKIRSYGRKAYNN